MWRRVPVTQKACRRNGRTGNSRKRLATHKEEAKEAAELQEWKVRAAEAKAKEAAELEAWKRRAREAKEQAASYAAGL